MHRRLLAFNNQFSERIENMKKIELDCRLSNDWQFAKMASAEVLHKSFAEAPNIDIENRPIISDV